MQKLVKYTILNIMLALVLVGCTINVKAEEVTKVAQINKVQIPVLMYHHFEEDKSKITSATVQTGEFAKQMKYLSDNGYTAITSQDLLDYIKGIKKVPQKPILITSDDGYLSNYKYMYPILKENHLKGTIFIIGERVDHKSTAMVIPKVNWGQVKEMYESGVMDFQSHTYNSHDKVQLGKISKGNFSVAYLDETKEQYKDRIDKDIKLSIKGFEDNLGYKPIAFAYPYGEYSDISEEVLKENGIKLSFTIKNGFVTLSQDGYLLNRITVKGTDDFNTFVKKLSNQL